MDKKKTDGKPVYIITGATDALGNIITRNLAKRGNAIVMACFNNTKAEEVAQKLREETDNTDITVLHLDLGSFATTKQFVDEVKALNRPVAALINNASYISNHSELSPDGYQKIIQVNFLSTVLLSMLIHPLMPEEGRIVFTTSLTRKLAPLPYEFPATSAFVPIAAYAQSKQALTLFSIYLSTVLRTRHIRVNCADPGIVNMSMMSVQHFFGRFDLPALPTSPIKKREEGAGAIMRALDSNDTGFIFKGKDKQVKTSTRLKNREVFIKLCNDTVRLMKTHI